MDILEALVVQRQAVRIAEAALEHERDEQLRLMLAAKEDRYRNVDLARAMALSRERVGLILKKYETTKEQP